MTARASDEIVPLPDSGRIFAVTRRPGLADCAPSGRMRLDAIARWLQDVAYLDVDDAGVAGHAFWILRRTRIRVDRFPAINEPCRISTFCSGIGRLVAERRTSIRADGAGAAVEAAALWVHLDPVTHRPSNLTADELAIFASAGYGERRVSHRLIHPRPDPDQGVHRAQWRFRRVDTDVADHVNNSAYWELLEEELLDPAAPIPLALDAEVEFRDGAQPGVAHLFADGPQRRYVLDGRGELLATALLRDLVSAPEPGQ